MSIISERASNFWSISKIRHVNKMTEANEIKEIPKWIASTAGICPQTTAAAPLMLVQLKIRRIKLLTFLFRAHVYNISGQNTKESDKNSCGS